MSRPVSAGFNGTALYLATYPDDSRNEEGVYPNNVGINSQKWHVCWTMAYSYYYNVLGWVTGGLPQNPTCQSVGVMKVDITA